MLKHRVTACLACLAGGIILVLCALTAAPAAAQETHNMVPQPFDSEWFNREIVRLELDYNQRIAVESAHEHYKVQYRALREGDITELAEQLSELRITMVNLPPLDLLKDLLKTRGRVLARMQAMNRTLIEQVSAVVNEPQRPSFDRFSRLLEREWLMQASQEGMMDANYVDVLRLVERLELDEQAAHAVDTRLETYERTVNAALRTLHEKTAEMFDDFVDALDALGYDDARDEEDIQEMFGTFERVMNDVATDAREAAQDVEQVSERTVTELERLLPPRAGSQLRHLYRSERWPFIYSDPASPRTLIDGIEESESLTAAQKAQVQSITSQWRSRYESLSDQMLAMHLRSQPGSENYTPQIDWQKHWADFQAIQQERETVNTDARTRISQAIGEETSAQIEEAASRGSAGQGIHLGMMMATGSGGARIHVHAAGLSLTGEQSFNSVPRGNDAALPASMTIEEMNFYLTRLGLGDDQRTLATSFFDDYREEWQSLVDADYDRLVAQPQQRVYHQEHGVDMSFAELADEGRRALFESLLELDAALFDDIDVLLDGGSRERLEHIRTARSVVQHDLGPHVRSDGGAAFVDYLGIVRSFALSPAEMAAIEPALREYESQSLAVHRDLWDAHLERTMAQIRGSDIWRRSQQQGFDWQEASAQYQAIVAPPQERIDAGREAITALEENLISNLRADLPPRHLVDFELIYNRARYPDVYPDRHDALPTIDSALALDDLSADQRQALAGLRARQVAEHGRLSTRMMQTVDLRGKEPPSPEETEEFIAWETATAMFDTHDFDRRELNETLRREVRRTLTEEQAARVRGLDVNREMSSNM